MVLLVIQLVISLLLIVAIILQMQGSGLSTAFGGSGEFYRSKRSLEKILFTSTIVLSAFFAVISIILLIQK
ncbi:MAG TPA: preprotein translocase subunit SecG [Patescibacteria group bacterium]